MNRVATLTGTGEEAQLIRAVADGPHEENTARLVMADFYQENGHPERAELIRLQLVVPHFGAASKWAQAWAAKKIKNYRWLELQAVKIDTKTPKCNALRQLILLGMHDREWRSVKCEQCDGRGFCWERTYAERQVFAVRRDQIERVVTPPVYKEDRVECKICHSMGEAGGLYNWARNQQYLGHTMTGQFARGFFDEVALSIQDACTPEGGPGKRLLDIVTRFPTVRKVNVAGVWPSRYDPDGLSLARSPNGGFIHGTHYVPDWVANEIREEDNTWNTSQIAAAALQLAVAAGAKKWAKAANL